MKICIFGGAFDPPHLGHTTIAQTLLKHKKCAEVWFLPVGEHAFEKKMSSAADRTAMLELVLEPQMKIERYELDRTELSITYETLQALAVAYPQHTFSFVIGSDNIERFTEWHHYQEMLAQFPFWVYPRQGFPLTGLLPGMIALTEAEPIAVSSTEVRAAVRTGKSLEGLVNEQVAEYIQTHQLYT